MCAPPPNPKSWYLLGFGVVHGEREGGEVSSRPQMKEKVVMMETQTNSSPLPYFPPVVTLPAATTGYFRLKNKASDLFEQLLFHQCRSPGACGRPGLGHFPRELTRFPFAAKVQFSNSVWPILASPFPGWALHRQGARCRPARSMGLCLEAFLMSCKGRPGPLLLAPPPLFLPQSHTRNFHSIIKAPLAVTGDCKVRSVVRSSPFLCLLQRVVLFCVSGRLVCDQAVSESVLRFNKVCLACLERGWQS